MKITKAKARVLSKAACNGFVMISGGFSGQPNPKCIKSVIFDRKRHIEDLVNLGLLKSGFYSNQFVCTDIGKIILNQLPPSLRWKAEEETKELETSDAPSPFL